jgi:hypothetical protein
MPINPVSLEVEIRRIAVQGQPRKNVSETLSQQTNGGTYLPFQLHRRHRKKDCDLRPAQAKL